MAKRLSKEQLETDPLLTSYYLFTSFLKRNLGTVISASVAFVLLVGGGIYYYLHTQVQEEQAQELLVPVEQAFQMGDYETALQGNEQLSVGLIDIIDEYGRTSAGNLARYYAAVSEAELGNYEQALAYIERFDPPEGILGVGPVAFHAVILANLGELEQATDIFIKAAEWDENESTTPQNLLNAAQAAREAGNYERATELVERLLDEYEDAEVADEARRVQGILLGMQ